MSAVSVALLMTGVFLNAAAQLLLKAGTNAVGHFEFSLDNRCQAPHAFTNTFGFGIAVRQAQ